MRRQWHEKSWDSPKHLWEKLPDKLVKRCMKCLVEKGVRSHISPGPCKERDHYHSLPARIRRGDTKIIIDPNVPSGIMYIMPEKLEAKR